MFAELTYDDVEAATNAVVRQRVRARRGFGQRVTGDVAFDLAVAYGVGIDTLTGVLEGSPASHGELFDAISGLVEGGAIVGAESSIGVGDIDALTPYDLDIDPAILERIQSTPLGVRIDAVRPFEVVDVAGLQSWAAANAATFEQLFVIYGPYAQAQVTGPIGRASRSSRSRSWPAGWVWSSSMSMSSSASSTRTETTSWMPSTVSPTTPRAASPGG